MALSAEITEEAAFFVRYGAYTRNMATQYQEAYLDAKVYSASPLELVCLAYDGAINAVGEAREHLKGRRIHERSHAITRAMTFVTELTLTLDHTRGGEVSVQLSRLYVYMQDRLREANFHQIEQPLIDVQQLLETLGGGWKEIATTEVAAVSALQQDRRVWMHQAEDTPDAGRVSRAYSL
jgi:flagellar secretion chaperone FliS